MINVSTINVNIKSGSNKSRRRPVSAQNREGIGDSAGRKIAGLVAEILLIKPQGWFAIQLVQKVPVRFCDPPRWTKRSPSAFGPTAHNNIVAIETDRNNVIRVNLIAAKRVRKLEISDRLRPNRR
jgi:hypothetical protein